MEGQGTDVIVDLTDSDLNINDVTYDVTYYGVETEEKVHTITELPSVAAINGTEYKSIQAAVDAAVDGDVITVIADHAIVCNVDPLITVAGKSVTIDLNGKTVTADIVASGNTIRYIFQTAADGILTVQDSVGTGSVVANGEGVLYYMFSNTGEMTIKSGSFTMSGFEGGAMFYSTNSNMLVEGGYFEQNTTGWMFNTVGNAAGHVITVSGGTFNRYFIGGEEHNENKWGEVVLADGHILVDNENGTWTVKVGQWIAQINETGKTYESLAEAIAVVKNGETITLLADCDEDVTIKQTANKSFTIDGNGMTYTGTITIDGNKRPTGKETLTIQNVNFVVDGISIETVKSTSAHNITVDGCTFTGTDGSNYDYGMYLRHCYKITVKNTTGTNLVDLVYGNSAVDGFVAENCTVSDSVQGFWFSYPTGNISFKNVTTTTSGNVGIGFYNNASGTITFEDCNIDMISYVEKNTSKAVKMIFNDAANLLSVSNTHSTLTAVLNQADATITAIEGLNVIPSDELAKSYKVVYENGVYSLAHAIARNENTGKLYMDLSDGLAEAVSGETLVLLAETAEDLVLVPAGVIFDLNGHVVEAKNTLSFGAVIDTAATVGGIKISNNTAEAFTKLQPENGGYLPIYDTRDGMYKFFAYELTNASGVKVSGNTIKFGIQLCFANKAAFEVLANTEESGIDLYADVSWSNMTVPNLIFKLDEVLTTEYAQKKVANPSKNYAITLTIGGLENLQTGDFVRVTPILTTATEVGCRVETNEYIKG